MVTKRLALGLAFLALLAASAPLRAGDGGCPAGGCGNQEPAGAQGAGAPATTFDFYVLALSWSATYCEFGGGKDRRNAQCARGDGRGFVTHGLWPQYERGYPRNCPGPSAPSQVALDHAAGVYPDEGLARHEWRAHGTCSGKSPSDYFGDVKRAAEKISIPPPFQKPSGAQRFSPIDIQRAFVAANPGLRSGMIAVVCDSGQLKEVELCLTKDLGEFRACPEVAAKACRDEEITVPAPL